MDLGLISFKYNDMERNCRRVKLSDFSAIRDKIRKERINSLGQSPSPELVAKTVAQPINESEISDFMMSIEGIAFILYRCVHDVDETFKYEEAERMALDNDPFCIRLYEESKLINPTKPQK